MTSKEQAALWEVTYDYMESCPETDSNGSVQDFVIRYDEKPVISWLPGTDPILQEPGRAVEAYIKASLLNGVLSDKAITNCPAGAGRAGQTTLSLFRESLETVDPTECWVCYLWSSKEAPTGPYRAEDLFKVEMAMTVTTRHPFLYTWHMGITRNAMLNYVRGAIIHGRSSHLPHAFASMVMKAEHPELHYVCSNLLASMANIMKKLFQDDIGKTVVFGTEGNPVDYGSSARNAIMTTMDLQTVLFQGDYDEFVWPRYPGGSSDIQFTADIKTVAYKL
jgi:hypothetical protein